MDTPSPNTDYHWTPDARRLFLEELAGTGSVLAATRFIGKSRRAAYALRHRRDGEAFRIGWDAAMLLAQAAIADALIDRALHGYAERITINDDGGTTRERHSNPLAFRLLARIDRMVEAQPQSGSYAERVQLAAQDFAAFLDLIAPAPAERAPADDRTADPNPGTDPADLTAWFVDRAPPPPPAPDNTPSNCELPQNSVAENAARFRAKALAFTPLTQWFDALRARCERDMPEHGYHHQSIAMLFEAINKPGSPLTISDDERGELDARLRCVETARALIDA